MGAVFAKYYNFNETNNCQSRVDSSKITPKRKIIIDDPRSPTNEISRTPIQVAGEHEGTPERPVEQVQEILLYEEGTEVPLVKNSPRETANPSCARIMGLPPQGVQAVGDCQPQLDADMTVFLSGLSKGLALTETQKQKVMRTYRERENSVCVKKLQTAKQMATDDDTPPPRARVPLGDLNSMHHTWRSRSGKEDHRGLSLLSENTIPCAGSLHDASKVHAVWDQDATVVI